MCPIYHLTCEEFIRLMGEKFKQTIAKGMQSIKYSSLRSASWLWLTVLGVTFPVVGGNNASNMSGKNKNNPLIHFVSCS